jgi:hypothetical protein
MYIPYLDNIHHIPPSKLVPAIFILIYHFGKIDTWIPVISFSFSHIKSVLQEGTSTLPSRGTTPCETRKTGE